MVYTIALGGGPLKSSGYKNKNTGLPHIQFQRKFLHTLQIWTVRRVKSYSLEILTLPASLFCSTHITFYYFTLCTLKEYLFTNTAYFLINFKWNNNKLTGSTATTAWPVIGLRIEETASRYVG
jgi:hypothetical protein